MAGVTTAAPVDINVSSCISGNTNSFITRPQDLRVLLQSALDTLSTVFEVCQSWESVDCSQIHPLAFLDAVLDVQRTLRGIDLDMLKYRVYAAFHEDRLGQASLVSYSLLFQILPLYATVEEAVEDQLLAFCDDEDGEGMATAAVLDKCESAIDADDTSCAGPSSSVPVNDTKDYCDQSKTTPDEQHDAAGFEAADDRENSNEDSLGLDSCDHETVSAVVTDTISTSDCAVMHRTLLTQQVSDIITNLTRPQRPPLTRAHSSLSSSSSTTGTQRNKSVVKTPAATQVNEIVEAGWYRLVTDTGGSRDVYCRIVGAIVMVRVGGGWVEIDAFLDSWSAHHHQPTRLIDTGRATHGGGTQVTGMVPAIAKLCKSSEGTMKVMSWHSLTK